MYVAAAALSGTERLGDRGMTREGGRCGCGGMCACGIVEECVISQMEVCPRRWYNDDKIKNRVVEL